MEPITYLSGLSTVILGYLWFLYQGRDVSYSSVLNRSVSARREALYKARGLDIERWLDLISEAKSLKKEISLIKEDYDEDARARHKRQDEDERAKERSEARQQEGSESEVPDLTSLDEKHDESDSSGTKKKD
jgi:hypothetical protein